MAPDEVDPSRRKLLTYLLTGSLPGLAGCETSPSSPNNTENPTATETRNLGTPPTTSSKTKSPTPADTSPPTITNLHIDNWPGETIDSRAVYVAGTATDNKQITTITAELDTGVTAKQSTQATELEFELALPVSGGKAYEGTITATDSGAPPNDTSREFRTKPVPEPKPALTHDRLIGAHYYLWYGHPNIGWNNGYTGQPILGEYNSRNAHIIDQHVQWARQHGINWFNMSWWGPEKYSSITLRDHFFEATLAEDIQISILYETTYRLGRDSDSINLDDEQIRNQLVNELEYLAETYFRRANYLHIDGRPVVYLYATHRFTGDIKAGLQAVRDRLETDLYLIGNPIEATPPKPDIVPTLDVYDAVTPYSPVGLWLWGGYDDDFNSYIEAVDDLYHTWALAARDQGVSFIPATIPGCKHDHGQFVGECPEPSVGRLRQHSQIARQTMDPELQAVFVTSFNEWNEGTTVEPGEEYGLTYLEVIAEELGRTPRTHSLAEYPELVFDYSQTVSPDGDPRELAVVADRLSFYTADGAVIQEYDIGTRGQEPLLTEGAYTRNSWGDTQRSVRWLGGPTGRTVMYFPPRIATASKLTFVGDPVRDNAIEADIQFNGRARGTLSFGNRGTWRQYSISL